MPTSLLHANRFGKTPCHCKEYTLTVVRSSLAAGTATLLVEKDGRPLKCNVVGISFDICAPYPSPDVKFGRCCKQYSTDKDGRIDVTFPADAAEMIRINLNINLGPCNAECACIRLTHCIAPPQNMGACPMEYLGRHDREHSRAECCNC